MAFAEMDELAGLELETIEGGYILPIKAQPGASKNEVRGVHNGRLRVCVTQVAEKGKANKAIIKLLSKLLKIPASSLSIVSGESTAKKNLRIIGVEPRALLPSIKSIL